MKAHEIRQRFADFFIKNGHEKIASSSLVPHNDPTLLFANAGMNQFKDYFTGKSKPINKRAVTIQKVVRAGGKHNDLENVGFTARHHTFFEMLGNFSFGDYFKKDAIRLAWEFLTTELKMPKEKLYITVHESDQEAFDIWNKEIGINANRIFYMGDKDNFWEMGEVGPCGPCSEIFYDHGEKYSDGNDTSKCLLHDEGRYVEIWNLVFMQFEKYKEGSEIKKRPLPKPSVDTGAGLERVASAMQGVYWNYDTDIFSPILKHLEKLSGKSYQDQKYQANFRVVADHIRSSTMLITDGVIPSNEGRGYVLRRIIRRGVRHLEELGIHETSFYKLVPSVFESLGKEYPDNMNNASLAEKLLRLEEEKFRQTLKVGLDLIYKEIENLDKNSKFNGEQAFKLYDTYGFPLDLTEVILREKGLSLDIEGFDKAMQRQKDASKKNSKFSQTEDNLKTFYSIKEKFGATEFLGYKEVKSLAKLLDIVYEEDKAYLIFDKTPFYAESGGQVGDSGLLYFKDNDKNPILKISDVQKIVDGLFCHQTTKDEASNLTLGESYLLHIDEDLRNATAKNHSATHLLQSALIKVLGDHVKQAGSIVKSDYLRFDFTHTDALTHDEMKKVGKLVNEAIFKALPVSASIMKKDEATKKGAMALFGEKYGDEVRVLEMGDVSIELCGGTHVKNTSEIGLFHIVSEGSLSNGIRRIEAITSHTALKYLEKRSFYLQTIERMVSLKDEKAILKIEDLQKELKEKQKSLNELSQHLQMLKTKDLFNNAVTLKNGHSFISTILEGDESYDLRAISDNLNEKFQNTTLLLLSKASGKGSFLIKTNSSFNLNDISKDVLPKANARGGGKKELISGSFDQDKASIFVQELKSKLESL